MARSVSPTGLTAQGLGVAPVELFFTLFLVAKQQHPRGIRPSLKDETMNLTSRMAELKEIKLIEVVPGSTGEPCIKTKIKLSLTLPRFTLERFSKAHRFEFPHNFDCEAAGQLESLLDVFDPEDDHEGATLAQVQINRLFGPLIVDLQGGLAQTKLSATLGSKVTCTPKPSEGMALTFSLECLLTRRDVGNLAVSLGLVRFSCEPPQQELPLGDSQGRLAEALGGSVTMELC